VFGFAPNLGRVLREHGRVVFAFGVDAERDKPEVGPGGGEFALEAGDGRRESSGTHRCSG